MLSFAYHTLSLLRNIGDRELTVIFGLSCSDSLFGYLRTKEEKRVDEVIRDLCLERVRHLKRLCPNMLLEGLIVEATP